MKLIIGTLEYDIIRFNDSISFDNGDIVENTNASLEAKPNIVASEIATEIASVYDGTFTVVFGNNTRAFTGYALENIEYHIDASRENFDIRFRK